MMRSNFFKTVFQMLVLLVAIMLLHACSQVYFTEPQPTKGKAMATFPKIYCGTYQSDNLTLEIVKDALVIDGVRFTMTKELPNKGEVMMKFSNNFYFANFSDSTYYSVFAAQFLDNKLAVYMLNPDARSRSVLKRFISIEEMEHGEHASVLLSPSNKEFMTLVDNEVFDVVTVLSKDE